MKQFYARHKEIYNEIAVFSSEKERDDWVNFRDWFSIATNTTVDNCTCEREAITEEEAEIYGGDLLYLQEALEDDNMLDNVHWLIA